jgi:cell division protein FtsB
MHTRDVLDRRQGEVARLQQQQQQLQGRIDTVDSGHVLVREARRLGLVKPGERLYIVRGIPAWRKKH